MKRHNLIWLTAFVIVLLAAPLYFSNVDAQEKPKAQSPYEKGVELYKSEKYAEAIEAFQQAVKLDSKNVDALFQLGNSYRSLGRFPEAVESYKQALQLKPKWAEALYGLGVTYGMSGSPKDAVTFLKESISQKPDNDKAHYNLGVAYTDLGQIAEAAASFKEATRLNPKDADYFFNLGMAYQQLNKLKESEDAYANSILLDENNAEAHYQIALVYLAMGNRGFATIHYLALEKLNPALAKKLHDEMFKKYRGAVSSRAKHNNSFNPTALSAPLINLASCDVGCVVAPGGGLIRALDASLFPAPLDQDGLYMYIISVHIFEGEIHAHSNNIYTSARKFSQAL